VIRKRVSALAISVILGGATSVAVPMLSGLGTTAAHAQGVTICVDTGNPPSTLPSVSVGSCTANAADIAQINVFAGTTCDDPDIAGTGVSEFPVAGTGVEAWESGLPLSPQGELEACAAGTSAGISSNGYPNG
jgi:hypothetical protein